MQESLSLCLAEWLFSVGWGEEAQVPVSHASLNFTADLWHNQRRHSVVVKTLLNIPILVSDSLWNTGEIWVVIITIVTLTSINNTITFHSPVHIYLVEFQWEWAGPLRNPCLGQTCASVVSLASHFPSAPAGRMLHPEKREIHNPL